MSKPLPEPKKAIAEVLYCLITRTFLKEQDMRLNSFRDCMSQLRNYYNSPIRHVDIPGKTRHGRPVKYRKHFLLTISRARASRIYLQINAA